MRKLLGRLSIVLAHRYFPIVLVVLAIVIMTPALKVGWIMDDVIHRLALLDASRVSDELLDLFAVPTDRGRLSFAVNHLYSFIHPGVNLAGPTDYGLLPWWTFESLRISFWRPITSFTLWLDYQLFPDSALLMHTHSILWFAAVVFLVTMLYRRLIGPAWIAGLAGLLYALDDNYYFPVMLLANRHILLALVFGILALFAHWRWRRHNSLPAAGLAFCCFTLSLLSAEAGIATLIYIFAYALTLDNGTYIKRTLSLTPYLIVVVLWRIIYNALGHGAYGSGFYVDPVREPILFAAAVLKRSPILLQGQLGPVPSIIYMFLSEQARIVAWFIAAGFVAFVLIMFIPMLRKNRVSRFWFIAALLSVLPICATVPQNRNLFFVGIGAMALVAQFVAGLFTKESWLPKSSLWRIPAWLLCIILLLTHVGLAGLSRAYIPKMLNLTIRESKEKILDIGPLPELEKQDLIVVNTLNSGLYNAIFFFRAQQGQSQPRAFRALCLGLSEVEATRTKDNVILLRSRNGSLFSAIHQPNVHPLHWVYFHERFNSLVRSSVHPFHIGDRFDLPRMSVEVKEVDSRGRPMQALFTFAVSLDDPSLRWLRWDWKKRSFSPFTVPAIGERAEIAGPFQ